MSRIRLLPDELVSQIAAGEVVERPASVVKELVENALDAGAAAIDIELLAGGKRLVRVSDDGAGMGRDDALLAFDRHATSKIASFDDLERVASLGFRGEALSSIAGVARVELTTAEEAGEGHRVRIAGGRVGSAQPASRPRGTTVEVASLFFNVPARRKFLKTPGTELRHCLQVAQGYALARPEVSFTLHQEGRSLLEAPVAGEGREGLRQRVRQVFGAALADHLVAIRDPATDADGEISGFVGDPTTTRGRRLFVFVNRRLLRDRAVLATFYRAVRQEWKDDAFPALFLFIQVDPAQVDVNVHPQKAEVRFRDRRLVDRVGEALRDALARARGEEEAPLRPPVRPPEAPLAWRGLGEGPAGSGRDRWAGWRGSTEVGESAADGAGGPPGAPGAGPRLPEVSYAPQRPLSVPLSGRSGEVRSFRLLGQYKGTLLLLEGPDGLYLIDQHVAHERILYERFRADVAAERSPSQALVEPLLLELAPAEALRLGEVAGELDEFGFALAEMSGDTLALTAVPASLALDEAEKLLMELARDDELEDGADPAALRRHLLDALAASMACRAAVKMHHPLAPEEMRALVSELFEAEQPYACPHGRPVVLQMTDAELERRFGRR